MNTSTCLEQGPLGTLLSGAQSGESYQPDSDLEIFLRSPHFICVSLFLPCPEGFLYALAVHDLIRVPECRCIQHGQGSEWGTKPYFAEMGPSSHLTVSRGYPASTSCCRTGKGAKPVTMSLQEGKLSTRNTVPWRSAVLRTQGGDAGEEKRQPDIALTGRKPAVPGQTGRNKIH